MLSWSLMTIDTIRSLKLLCSFCGDRSVVYKDLQYKFLHQFCISVNVGLYNSNILISEFRLYNPNKMYFRTKQIGLKKLLDI